LHRQTGGVSRRFLEPADGVRWRWPVLVRCPRCGARATVAGADGAPIRLTCGACSLARTWDGGTRFTSRDGEDVVRLAAGTTGWLDPATGRRWQGELRWPPGRDEHFGAELWLQRVCCGGRLLWARNAEHLEYLRGFVGGELREDRPGQTSKPPSSKLPAWLQEAKHRDEVLRHLERLRRTLG
jgi:hypothetical protein